jgi:hypothetical protein
MESEKVCFPQDLLIRSSGFKLRKNFVELAPLFFRYLGMKTVPEFNPVQFQYLFTED